MFAFLMGLIPLLPKMIEVGLVTFDVYNQIKQLIDEDRSMTPDERVRLEQMIAEKEAILHDTSRDVQQ